MTNNEDLQPYAAGAVFQHLQASACHETMIRVGGGQLIPELLGSRSCLSGYILGEFGHLIANEQGCSPIEQFQALHSKVNLCTAPSRALLLTTYIKVSPLRQSWESANRALQWVNLFPEIKEHLMNIFERYTHVLDAELQQRACEYLALAKRGDSDDLLSTICDEMPVFPERESALVNRLHKKGENAQDKRTWIIGQSSENKEREAERFKAFRKGQNDAKSAMTQSAAAKASNSTNGGPSTPTEPNAVLAPPKPQARSASLNSESMMGVTSNGGSDDIMSSLADLDLGGNSAGAAQEQPLMPDAPPTQGAARAKAVISAANGDDDSDEEGMDGSIQQTATLGGVAPELLAPLTVAPRIEKVCVNPLTLDGQG